MKLRRSFLYEGAATNTLAHQAQLSAKRGLRMTTCASLAGLTGVGKARSRLRVSVERTDRNAESPLLKLLIVSPPGLLAGPLLAWLHLCSRRYCHMVDHKAICCRTIIVIRGTQREPDTRLSHSPVN